MLAEDFTPFPYESTANPLAKIFDPTIDILAVTQKFTFDDYVTAKPCLKRYANVHGDKALRKALHSFKDFKTYLADHPLVPPHSPSSHFNDLVGVQAILREYFGGIETPIYFLRELGPVSGFSLANIEDARLLTQLNYTKGHDPAYYNAKMLVADPDGRWHLYLLDQPVYSTDFTHSGKHSGTSTMRSSNQGFTVIEFYTTDGVILENNTETLMEWSSPGIKAVLDADLVMKYKNIIRHVLRSANSAQETLGLESRLMALASPEEKTLLLMWLLAGYLKVDKTCLKRKIITVFKMIPDGDSQETDAIAQALEENNLFGFLFHVVDGEERLELLKTLQQKGLTKSLPEFHVLEPVVQAANKFGHSLASIADIIKHPVKTVSDLADMAGLVLHSRLGGLRRTDDTVVEASDQIALIVAMLKDRVSSDFQIYEKFGMDEQYIEECFVRALLEGSFLLWGIRDFVRGLATRWLPRLVQLPLAWQMFSAYVLVTKGYHYLAKEDYGVMKDYQKDLAISIEVAYDMHVSGIEAGILWLRRNVLGIPIRTLPQYDHADKQSLVLGGRKGALAFAADLLDNDKGARFFYSEGIRNFQEQSGAKYEAKILRDIHEMVAFGRLQGIGHELIAVKIQAYVGENAELIALLNGNIWNLEEIPILERVGVYSYKPVDFGLLNKYLEEN